MEWFLIDSMQYSCVTPVCDHMASNAIVVRNKIPKLTNFLAL